MFFGDQLNFPQKSSSEKFLEIKSKAIGKKFTLEVPNQGHITRTCPLSSPLNTRSWWQPKKPSSRIEICQNGQWKIYNSFVIDFWFSCVFWFWSGGIILRIACVDYTLYSRINGRIRTRLRRSWRSLLEFSGKSDFFLGGLPVNGSSCFFSCLQIYSPGIFFVIGSLTTQT